MSNKNIGKILLNSLLYSDVQESSILILLPGRRLSTVFTRIKSKSFFSICTAEYDIITRFNT
jgi:hypothetical protein